LLQILPAQPHLDQNNVRLHIFVALSTRPSEVELDSLTDFLIGLTNRLDSDVCRVNGYEATQHEFAYTNYYHLNIFHNQSVNSTYDQIQCAWLGDSASTGLSMSQCQRCLVRHLSTEFMINSSNIDETVLTNTSRFLMDVYNYVCLSLVFQLKCGNVDEKSFARFFPESPPNIFLIYNMYFR
jgi:hypothetical protein